MIYEPHVPRKKDQRCKFKNAAGWVFHEAIFLDIICKSNHGESQLNTCERKERSHVGQMQSLNCNPTEDFKIQNKPPDLFRVREEGRHPRAIIGLAINCKMCYEEVWPWVWWPSYGEAIPESFWNPISACRTVLQQLVKGPFPSGAAHPKHPHHRYPVVM